MMIFGNTEVVPVYYCTFTLISIVGGGVVYREFHGMPWQGWLQFLAGVTLAIGGDFTSSLAHSFIRSFFNA